MPCHAAAYLLKPLDQAKLIAAIEKSTAWKLHSEGDEAKVPLGAMRGVGCSASRPLRIDKAHEGLIV
jgi:YesN/AraC family two-component response regulator